jgi:hypothetical protein
MFDTREIQQMTDLIRILVKDKFYKTLTFYVTSNSSMEADVYKIGNEETKFVFGVPRKNLEVVSITLYRDRGELKFHKTGKTVQFVFSKIEADNLNLEQKIIFALDQWRSYFSN